MIRCVEIFISRKNRPGPGRVSLVIKFGNFIFASCIFVLIRCEEGGRGGGEVGWEGPGGRLS